MPHLAANPMEISWLVPEIQAVEHVESFEKQKGKQEKFVLLIACITK